MIDYVLAAQVQTLQMQLDELRTQLERKPTRKDVRVTIPDCDPSHTYEIAITYKDAKGKTIATGTQTITGKCTSPYQRIVRVA